MIYQGLLVPARLNVGSYETDGCSLCPSGAIHLSITLRMEWDMFNNLFAHHMSCTFNYPKLFRVQLNCMPVKYLLILVSAGFISLATQSFQETDLYYIKDKGIYIHCAADGIKKKFPFKEHWSFYVTIKNDSVAYIQDIKYKTLSMTRVCKIGASYDTVYIKRQSPYHGSIERVFRTIY